MIGNMIGNEFISSLRENLLLEAEEGAMRTGRGAAKDWDDYIKRVARCKALEEAADMLAEHAQRFFNEDEETDLKGKGHEGEPQEYE